MEFNGFRSISEYESECRRLGYITQRIPFYRNGAEFFALLTSPPQQTATSCQSWHLFTADESTEILDGVIFPCERVHPLTREILPPGKTLDQQLAAHGFTKKPTNIEQADRPERKIAMKKYMGNYTSEASKVLKSSQRVVCSVTDDGTIYVSNGYFIFKMDAREYAAIVQPVVHCEPGNWRIDDGNKRDDDFHAAQYFDDAVKAVTESDILARCPLTLDANKIPAACYYQAAADFAAFYNVKFISSLHSDVTFRAPRAISPAVAYIDGEPFAMIMPIKPEDNATRAVKAYFTKPNNDNPNGEADKLRTELAAANDKLAQANALIAQLREQIAQQTAAQAPAPAQHEAPQPTSDEPKTAAELIAARFAGMAGVTATIKGAQTTAPVVWLSGDTDKHADAIKAAGAKWSNKRAAFYVRVA